MSQFHSHMESLEEAEAFAGLKQPKPTPAAAAADLGQSTPPTDAEKWEAAADEAFKGICETALALAKALDPIEVLKKMHTANLRRVLRDQALNAKDDPHRTLSLTHPTIDRLQAELIMRLDMRALGTHIRTIAAEIEAVQSLLSVASMSGFPAPFVPPTPDANHDNG